MRWQSTKGFAVVSYNSCDYIRELYEDFFIHEVERPNSQSKKENSIYREYIMTNYDPRTFAPQMSFFSEYGSGDKNLQTDPHSGETTKDLRRKFYYEQRNEI